MKRMRLTMSISTALSLLTDTANRMEKGHNLGIHYWRRVEAMRLVVQAVRDTLDAVRLGLAERQEGRDLGLTIRGLLGGDTSMVVSADDPKTPPNDDRGTAIASD